MSQNDLEKKIPFELIRETELDRGGQVRTHNPKIIPYVEKTIKGWLYFDAKGTYKLLQDAYKKVYDVVSKGGKVLFVGTKPSPKKDKKKGKKRQHSLDILNNKSKSFISEDIKEYASAANQYFVSDRWLGGTLTNSKTIFSSLEKYDELKHLQEEFAKDGGLSTSKIQQGNAIISYSKKEKLGISRQIEKIEKNLGGIKDMKILPKLLIVIDPNKEKIAVEEARRLHIPIVGLVDTFSNPELVDYVIPGNERVPSSVEFVIKVLANAALDAQNKPTLSYANLYLAEQVVVEPAPAPLVVIEEKSPLDSLSEAQQAAIDEVNKIIKPIEKQVEKPIPAAPHGDTYTAEELTNASLSEIRAIAKKLGLINVNKESRGDLAQLILDEQAKKSQK